MTRTRFTIDPSLSDEEIALRLIALREGIEVEEARAKYASTTPVTKASDVSAPIHIVKTSKPSKNLVFGWASVPFTRSGTQLEDHQGHLIDVEDLEDAAYNFVVKYRTTGDMHTPDSPTGQLVESMVFTPDKKAELGITADIPDGAWWVGFRVPPDVHAKVRAGERSMFSIEGTARLEPA